jgi:hypothetical protein
MRELPVFIENPAIYGPLSKTRPFTAILSQNTGCSIFERCVQTVCSKKGHSETWVQRIKNPAKLENNGAAVRCELWYDFS